MFLMFHQWEELLRVAGVAGSLLKKGPDTWRRRGSLEEADPRHEARRRREARGRERWPADLSVVEEIIDPQEVQKAPQDWRLIGAEVSEQLDYEPGRFLRRRLVRRK
jgi:hypothetical protein